LRDTNLRVTRWTRAQEFFYPSLLTGVTPGLRPGGLGSVNLCGWEIGTKTTATANGAGDTQARLMVRQYVFDDGEPKAGTTDTIGA